jgi:hypothetical protein
MDKLGSAFEFVKADIPLFHAVLVAIGTILIDQRFDLAFKLCGRVRGLRWQKRCNGKGENDPTFRSSGGGLHYSSKLLKMIL